MLFHCQSEAHRSLVCLVCFAFHAECSPALFREVEFWPMHFHIQKGMLNSTIHTCCLRVALTCVCVCSLLLFVNTVMCIVLYAQAHPSTHASRAFAFTPQALGMRLQSRPETQAQGYTFFRDIL